jgi:predicted metal-binding membrane protein
MLLMFAVGAGNLGWMLGAVMGVEKNVSWGKTEERVLGLVTSEREGSRRRKPDEVKGVV